MLTDYDQIKKSDRSNPFYPPEGGSMDFSSRRGKLNSKVYAKDPNKFFKHSDHLKFLVDLDRKADFQSVRLKKDNPLKDSVEVFKRKLMCYKSIYGQEICNEIFYNSLIIGPEYSALMKKRRFENFIDGCIYTYNTLENVNHSFTFPEDHLFPWDEETNDYQWAFLEEKPIDKDLLDLFEEELRILVDAVHQNHKELPQDWLDEPELLKTSASRIEDTSFPQRFHSMYKSYNKNLLGVRKVIKVAPSNFRDAAIPHPGNLRYLKKYSKRMSEYISQMPGSVQYNSKASVMMKQLLQAKQAWYHIDIKKCGWSFPHQLVRVISKVFGEIHEDFDIMSKIEQGVLLVDNIPYNIRRGYYLGWFNELPTIAHCVIYQILKRYFIEDLHGLFFNDDSVYWNPFESDEISKKNLNIIIENYQLFGFIIATKKCFVDHDRRLFLEVYHRGSDILPKLERLACVLGALSCKEQDQRYSAMKFYYKYHRKQDLDLFRDFISEFITYDFSDKLKDIPLIMGGEWKPLVYPQNIKGYAKFDQETLNAFDQHISYYSEGPSSEIMSKLSKRKLNKINLYGQYLSKRIVTQRQGVFLDDDELEDIYKSIDAFDKSNVGVLSRHQDLMDL